MNTTSISKYYLSSHITVYSLDAAKNIQSSIYYAVNCVLGYIAKY